MYSVEVSQKLETQIENPIFASLFEDVKKQNVASGEEQRVIWIDVRDKCPDLTAEEAALIARFITHYDANTEKQADAFKKYREFKAFEPVATKLGFNQKVDLKKLKETV